MRSGVSSVPSSWRKRRSAAVRPSWAASWATTVTPGIWHMARMLQAADGLPVNVGFTGKGNVSLPRPIGAYAEVGDRRPFVGNPPVVLPTTP